MNPIIKDGTRWPKKWYEITRTKKWDEMSWYEMVLARQVPEPEWYPAGLFGACISQSPKQNRSNIRLACRSKQDIFFFFLAAALNMPEKNISWKLWSLPFLSSIFVAPGYIVAENMFKSISTQGQCVRKLSLSVIALLIYAVRLHGDTALHWT